MPSTVRVSDLAKEVGMEPGELLRVLQADFSLRVRTVSSSIRDADARKVRNRLRLQQRRASRPDRRLQAEENIRRAAEQRRLREAAEAKARGEAERKAREEAEKKAQEEAEAKARAEEEEAARRSAEAAEAEQRAEAARQAAEAAAQEPEAETAPEPTEPAQEKRPAPTAAPQAGDGAIDVRTGPTEAPARPERMAAVSAKPAETPAPAAPRRIETRIITSPSGPAEFRPGATDRKIVPAVTRPVRRATPPRIRATPPPLRRSPAAPPKAQRPAPGRRSKGRRRQAPAETPESLEGFDSPLPPGLRQAVTREYRTNASVALSDGITVKGLAEAMSIPTVEVIKALLLQHGVAASINQPLDTEIATKLVQHYGGTIVEAGTGAETPAGEALAASEAKEDPKKEDLVERAPVVTVMGHVDHGKTSLLDAIRSARVVDTEAGGITQHMSAYTVETNGHRLVFLDTPGHEAFTKMRARGAGVTDVVILVVAADDGVKEQTIEALNHARAAGVPIVVAVNKMDKPAADPDLVMRQLAEREVTPEDWGGDSIFCQVSAKTHDGLPELLQSVLDVAELEEPTANPRGPAQGVVLEARKDKGRGPVAQFLIQEGTLSVGDTVSAGAAWGKVRALLDESGRRMKKAPPSTPCEVLGLTEVPVVGDPFSASQTPAEARRAAEEKKEEARLQLIEGRQRLNLQNLHAQMSGGLKELSIVVKADVGGTVEAVRDALERLSTEDVKVRVIHAGAGAVSESDVNLASATESIIVAFGVRPDPQAQRLAEQEKVEIRGHTVIYHLVEEMEKALAGLLEPETEIVELGKIEVRRTFQVPRVGVVAGSYVLAGTVPRNSRVRLVRDGRLVHTGRIGSLRRFKEDVAQVREGFECGVGIAGYNDVKIGDIIEAFREEQVSPVAD
ncbi:MAG: translation initiation factor IF-2 [Acidobacteria bacterium]|nr:translation initiation factor IF-2 [Acidobacteriota bacterium]MYF15533.1 translation initiation factor IF-2 [Acidobacteriota bacterium]MYI96569.1 translation initiation factor IF-2 [Acidobacteriota bacterium]